MRVKPGETYKSDDVRLTITKIYIVGDYVRVVGYDSDDRRVDLREDIFLKAYEKTEVT